MNKNLVLFGIGFITTLIIMQSFHEFRETEPELIDISDLKIVYTEDTTQILDMAGRAIGVIYPCQMMFRDTMLQTINDMTQVSIFAWIWHENIIKQGDELLLCQEENFRQGADVTIMGRLKGNIKLVKIYDGKGKKWFLFSFTGLIPTHSLQTREWYKSQSFRYQMKHFLSGPDLTFHGEKAATHGETLRYYSDPVLMLAFIVLLGSMLVSIYYWINPKYSPAYQRKKTLYNYLAILLGTGAGIGVYLALSWN